MRLCLIGINGQLGSLLKEVCHKRGLDLIGFGRRDLDISNRDAVERELAGNFPFDLIINAAAYTKVDLAEEQVEHAFAANSVGPGYLAEFCNRHSLPLIHVSTDYVFDGTKRKPYLPYDPPSPVGIYGRSKAEGEQRVLAYHKKSIIIRCSWLYSRYGRNFVNTMITLGREREKLQVIDDQQGCPTYAGDLAEAMLDVAEAIISREFRQWGIYHYCNSGSTTWYRMACKIFEIARPLCKLKVKEVEPISSSQYPSAVERPPYSVLDCSSTEKMFGIKSRPWQEALEEVVRSICLDPA